MISRLDALKGIATVLSIAWLSCLTYYVITGYLTGVP